MTPAHTRGLTAALLAAVTVAACSSARRQRVQTSPQQAREERDLYYIAKAKADSARYPYTTADVQFMQGMIHHHAQAIVMSRWAPTHGASPSVQTLASRIINAQQDEIAIMSTWLQDRRQQVPEPTATGMKMMMDGAEHEMLMPGMLTEEQMKQLDQARGYEFDRLFLTFMIQHHKGAVSMVQDLFASEGAGQDEMTFKLATDVNVDQTTEIARMERMLVALMLERPSQ